MNRSISSDSKLLRAKNKELEKKCRDLERRLQEEQTLRTSAESKVRQLKKRLREYMNLNAQQTQTTTTTTTTQPSTSNAQTSTHVNSNSMSSMEYCNNSDTIKSYESLLQGGLSTDSRSDTSAGLSPSTFTIIS